MGWWLDRALAFVLILVFVFAILLRSRRTDCSRSCPAERDGPGAWFAQATWFCATKTMPSTTTIMIVRRIYLFTVDTLPFWNESANSLL